MGVVANNTGPGFNVFALLVFLGARDFGFDFVLLPPLATIALLLLFGSITGVDDAVVAFDAVEAAANGCSCWCWPIATVAPASNASTGATSSADVVGGGRVMSLSVDVKTLGRS